ncbi:MAG TPA: hypothetical protein VM510_02580 [Caulifigura sp.]|jgi:hypothetical protein|nr:hypothetical protein [Caulifigura sp.]
MAGRQLIIRCLDAKWSACYSDRPEERYYGVTMQDAVDRLVKGRMTSNPSHDAIQPAAPGHSPPGEDGTSG